MHLANFSVMYQTAALLCFLVSIKTVCSLLSVFNYLYPIFTFVLVPCKFMDVVKSLSTHRACLHSHLSLPQECAFEINPLFMLYVSWVGSHDRAAALCTRDFLCETELEVALQCTRSTGPCIVCINSFSLHTHSCWIALLANTCSCRQPATSQMLSLACHNNPFPSILMCLWTHS